MRKTCLKNLATWGYGSILSILFLLLASGTTLLSQTGADPASNKNESDEAARQILNAARSNDVATVRSLLGQGVSVNAKDAKGATPLFKAVFRDHMEMAGFLLDNGADVNARANTGSTPLMLAAFQGYMDMVGLLLAKGADINSEDDAGLTALMDAIVNGQTDVTKLLLEKGANPDVKDLSGRTALILASHMGNTEAVRLLLHQGADVNAQDHEGWTPLMEAATGGNVDVVKLLLAGGANANLKESHGYTALLIASSADQTNVVALLVSQPGATANAAIPSGISSEPPQTNVDSSGYVTNASLLNPFSLTNSSGAVITDAVLVKLTPTTFIYKTSTGGGMLPLASLPPDMLAKIGYDPQAAAEAAEAEQLAKVHQQDLARQQSQAAYQPANPPAPGSSLSPEVSRSIRANAEKQWPDDYQMQLFAIKKQTEAYNWVVAASSDSRIPQDAFDQIKTKAVSEWPDDYEMQKFEINQEVQAYVQLR